MIWLVAPHSWVWDYSLYTLLPDSFSRAYRGLGHETRIIVAVSATHTGMNFWKTGKIVKAISEADYQKLQRSMGRNDPGQVILDQAMPHQGNLQCMSCLILIQMRRFIPLWGKERSFFHISSPPGSDSDFSSGPRDCTHPSTTMETMLKNVVSMVKDMKDKKGGSY